MKYISAYKELLGCNNEDEVFQYFLNNLKTSNNLWTYFVNWSKVFENIKDIEIGLNTLNYLIGKDNFDSEFINLLKQNPQLIKILPTLVVRNGGDSKKFKILVDFRNKKLTYEDFDFTINNPTEEDLKKYLKFITNTGFRELIINKKIKNLVDYMIGVEAGLDSNARKNRGGHSMEDIVGVFVQDLCSKKGYDYLKEADAEKIKKTFNLIYAKFNINNFI